MEVVTVRLKAYLEEATTTEKAIIQYILKDPKRASRLTVYKLAEETFTSTSSIVRLCKRNGFNGYKSFSKALVYEVATRENYKQKEIKEIKKTDTISQITHKVTQKNILSLEETSELLDETVLKRCLKLIDQADKLVFFGIGASLIVAKDAQLKFIRMNKLAYVNDDWHTQLLMAKHMTAKDVAIVISYSGKTKEMITCLDALKENGARAISITKYGENPIQKLADENLFVASYEYAFRSGAMSSRLAQLNLIDILYTGFLNKQYENAVAILEKTQMSKEVDSIDRFDQDGDGKTERKDDEP